jgi:hypothetical protein
VTLLSNVVHECRHFKQTSCQHGGFPPDPDTGISQAGENDAAQFLINFFTANAIALCDQMVEMGICATPFDCYDELGRESNEDRQTMTPF